MATPAGPYYPTNDLVAVAYLGQRIPGITSGMVATSLPGFRPDRTLPWGDEGFVQVSPFGGIPDVDIPVRHPLVQLDFWAANVSGGSVAAKPAWNKANRLFELVRVGLEESTNFGKPVTLPDGYLGARVLSAYLISEAVKMTDDPSGYAHFSADLAIDWARI